MARTDQIQKEFVDIAGCIRLCHRRLNDVMKTLESSGDRSELGRELWLSAETFLAELRSTTTVLETAAAYTAEDVGGKTRQPPEDHLESDLELLEEGSRAALAETRDLATTASWMLQRLPLVDRQMLIDLRRRFGTFEKGIAIMPDLLAIVGTPEDAVFALEDLRLLREKEEDMQLQEIDPRINLKAVLFILEKVIEAGSDPYYVREMKQLRDRLIALDRTGKGEDDAGS